MTVTAPPLCPVCGGPNTRGWGAKYCSTKCNKRAHPTARYRDNGLVRQHKLGKPCADCGIIWPYYVLQFDHVPERGPKLFSLSNPAGRSPQEILDEIAKCDLVCANCHMIRTQGRATGRPGLSVRLLAVEQEP